MCVTFQAVQRETVANHSNLVCWQVVNSQAVAVQLEDLLVELKGLEQVDPTWVSAAWAAQEGAHLPHDGRRLARQLLQAQARGPPGATTLLPGASMKYVFRCDAMHA